MTDEERRSEAWTNALHCEGTRVVFDRRSRSLRSKVRIRDFSGLAVPICLAYLLGSEVFPLLQPYRHIGVGALGLAAVLQTLMVAWSLQARWDEELGNNINSASVSYQLKEGWKRIGKLDVTDLVSEYNIFSRLQSVADAEDAKKGITDAEKRKGMRAALIEFQKACVCGHVPTKPKPPLRKQHPCGVCGGN